MTTNVYAAKRALFARLRDKAADGQPLAGIQVAYAFPGQVDQECIYGGGVRFDHQDAVAEHPGIMVTETALVSLYVRIVGATGDDVEATDDRAAEVLATITALLRAEPRLAGGQTWLGIQGGQGDYDTNNGALSILAAQVAIGSHLAYGG